MDEIVPADMILLETLDVFIAFTFIKIVQSHMQC